MYLLSLIHVATVSKGASVLVASSSSLPIPPPLAVAVYIMFYQCYEMGSFSLPS